MHRVLKIFQMSVLLPLFWAVFMPLPAISAPVRLAVAASLRPLAEDLVADFGARSSFAPPLVSSAASGTIAAQIRAGAPFDIFISADMATPQALAQGQDVIALMKGRLVLWSAEPVDLADLPSPVAIANPQLAPYGRAAIEVLEATGQAEISVVHGQNVGQAAMMAASGNAPAALLAAALVSDHGEVRSVPQELYAPIWHGAILLRDAPETQAFWTYLQGDAARALIREAGYER